MHGAIRIITCDVSVEIQILLTSLIACCASAARAERAHLSQCWSEKGSSRDASSRATAARGTARQPQPVRRERTDLRRCECDAGVECWCCSCGAEPSSNVEALLAKRQSAPVVDDAAGRRAHGRSANGHALHRRRHATVRGARGISGTRQRGFGGRGWVATTCWEGLLGRLAARACYEDLLRGLAARICCDQLLLGIPARNQGCQSLHGITATNRCLKLLEARARRIRRRESAPRTSATHARQHHLPKEAHNRSTSLPRTHPSAVDGAPLKRECAQPHKGCAHALRGCGDKASPAATES